MLPVSRKDAGVELIMGDHLAACGERALGAQLAGKVLQRRGQAVVGGGKAGPLGVPAVRRHGLSPQDGDGRRVHRRGQVRVPARIAGRPPSPVVPLEVHAEQVMLGLRVHRQDFG